MCVCVCAIITKGGTILSDKLFDGRQIKRYDDYDDLTNWPTVVENTHVVPHVHVLLCLVGETSTDVLLFIFQITWDNVEGNLCRYNRAIKIN